MFARISARACATIGVSLLVPSYSKPSSLKAYSEEMKDSRLSPLGFDDTVIIAGSELSLQYTSFFVAFIHYDALHIGASNQLTSQICKELNLKVGLSESSRFSDGEVNCSINESVRGKHVFIIQTCAAPVNGSPLLLFFTHTSLLTMNL